MTPNPGCLPALYPQHRRMDIPVFQEKTIGFLVLKGTPLFPGHSGPRRAMDPGTDIRLSGFCAFSNASILTGFFAIKTVFFKKQRFKRRIFLSVDTISTAEFFRVPTRKSLRRRMIQGRLTVFLLWGVYKERVGMRAMGGPGAGLAPDPLSIAGTKGTEKWPDKR